VCRWERNFVRLPARHKELLASQPEKYARARQCIYSNSFFIQSMVRTLLVSVCVCACVRVCVRVCVCVCVFAK